jgi:exosome complex component RRP45
MPREVGPSANERAFVLQALKENIRVDGRAFDAFRELHITFGDEYGVADVRLGKTRFVNLPHLVFHTLMNMKNPCTYISRSSASFSRQKVRWHIHNHHGAVANGITVVRSRQVRLQFHYFQAQSPYSDPNRPTELESILARLLEKAIRRSNALDTESLCILAGQKCWSIRADLHVLDYDGGLIDASCIATIAALQHFRRPDVSIKGTEVSVFTLAEREPLPLSMLHHPLCVTMSFFNEGETVIVDATLQEQQVSEGELVVTANSQGEVCQIAKMGGVPVDAVALLRCTEVAMVKVAALSRVLRASLEADAQKRDANGMAAELRAENER